MDLPTDLAIEFDGELRKTEEEHKMPYVTSIEQRGLEKGRDEGRVAGQIQLIQRLLGQPETTMTQLLTHPLEELRGQLDTLQKDMAARMG